MPDAAGRIRGIVVPRIPWHEDGRKDCPACDGKTEDPYGGSCLRCWSVVGFDPTVVDVEE